MEAFYKLFILFCAYFILIAIIFDTFFAMKRKRVQALLTRMPRRLKMYYGGKK